MKIEILSIALVDIQSGQHFFGYYRALSKRLPYAICYRVSEQTIQVWRVLDCRQKPSRIVDALRT
jgi:plasmid stabilization system protein ParE